MDPNYYRKLDPDPHYSKNSADLGKREKAHPDSHESDVDSQSEIKLQWNPCYKLQNSRNQGFSTIFASWWWKDPAPDTELYLLLTDPDADPGDPETYESPTLVVDAALWTVRLTCGEGWWEVAAHEGLEDAVPRVRHHTRVPGQSRSLPHLQPFYRTVFLQL